MSQTMKSHDAQAFEVFQSIATCFQSMLSAFRHLIGSCTSERHTENVFGSNPFIRNQADETLDQNRGFAGSGGGNKGGGAICMGNSSGLLWVCLKVGLWCLGCLFRTLSG